MFVQAVIIFAIKLSGRELTPGRVTHPSAIVTVILFYLSKRVLNARIYRTRPNKLLRALVGPDSWLCYPHASSPPRNLHYIPLDRVPTLVRPTVTIIIR